MKKVITIVIALILAMTACATAEDIDLSGLTLDELIALRQRITMAMWETEEYQEVIVPPGIWIVGEDIPAGTWTIKCADINSSNADLSRCYFKYGYTLKEDGNDIKSASTFYDYFVLYNPKNKYTDEGELTEYPVTLLDGMYVYIEKGYGHALFTTYLGKPSLGFK